jgi:hypothetical protein
VSLYCYIVLALMDYIYFTCLYRPQNPSFRDSLVYFLILTIQNCGTLAVSGRFSSTIQPTGSVQRPKGGSDSECLRVAKKTILKSNSRK